MKFKTLLITSGVLGVVIGLGTTYPYSLRFLPAIILWGIGGLLVGIFAKSNLEAIRAGIVYGVFLAIAFLLSRFGGSSDKLPSYFLLIAILSIGAAIGGGVATYIGSKLRRLLKKDM